MSLDCQFKRVIMLHYCSVQNRSDRFWSWFGPGSVSSYHPVSSVRLHLEDRSVPATGPKRTGTEPGLAIYGDHRKAQCSLTVTVKPQLKIVYQATSFQVALCAVTHSPFSPTPSATPQSRYYLLRHQRVGQRQYSGSPFHPQQLPSDQLNQPK